MLPILATARSLITLGILGGTFNVGEVIFEEVEVQGGGVLAVGTLYQASDDFRSVVY